MMILNFYPQFKYPLFKKQSLRLTQVSFHKTPSTFLVIILRNVCSYILISNQTIVILKFFDQF